MMECLQCSNVPTLEELEDKDEAEFEVDGLGNVKCKIERISSGFMRGVAKIRDVYRTVEVWYDIHTRKGHVMAY